MIAFLGLHRWCDIFPTRLMCRRVVISPYIARGRSCGWIYSQIALGLCQIVRSTDADALDSA